MRFFVLSILFALDINTLAYNMYHSYQKEMKHTLIEKLGERNIATVGELFSDKDFKIHESITYDSIDVNNLLKGIPDNAVLFLDISNFFNPLCQWPESYTQNDVETISQWWDKNDIAIDSDFMADILWYKRTLSRFEFMLTPYENYGIKLRERLNDRIIYRQSKTILCNDDNINIDSASSWNNDRELLKIQQKRIQEIFNNDNTFIESIIPFQEMKFYVYISKKLMTGEVYDMLTPISRKEFEDMEDWWFVNGCDVSDSIIKEILNEYNMKLYN